MVTTFIDESGKDPNCCFDAEWCADGNQALGHYRYEVDEKLGSLRKEPCTIGHHTRRMRFVRRR